jgi:hypothetical protein
MTSARLTRVPEQPYLYRRGGVLYFRRSVPPEARQAFGKTEVLVSLGTANAHLLVKPEDGKPVSAWSNRNEAWHDVAEGIAQAATFPTRNAPVTAEAEPPVAEQGTAPVRSFWETEPEPVRPHREGLSTRIKHDPSDKERDEFRLTALQTIYEVFEASVARLPDQLEGCVRRLDADRFTTTLYRGGKKVAGCTVYTGSGGFGRDSISYNGNDDGSTNTANEIMNVKAADGRLGLEPTMGVYRRDKPPGLLSPEDAAEWLWESLTEHLHG